MSQKIEIKNATTHNLKRVSCTIPHGTLCCLTGVSGSGKSSLAFDTLFIEGQRRFVQSLSPQAKRIIGSLPKPDVEAIEGLTPTIAIEQKRVGGSVRSTVGTITEIDDYLRLLFARLGVPHCPESGQPLVAMSRQEIIDAVLGRYLGSSVLLLTPVVRRKRGTLVEELRDLERKGFSRIRLDGAINRIEEAGDIDPSTSHTLDVVIDRLTVRSDQRDRITESITTALGLGKGLLVVVNATTNHEELLSEHAYSRATERSYPPLEPTDFSPNTYAGMCEPCQGIGLLEDESLCPSCRGSRLKPYPSAARLRGTTWQELTGKTVDEANVFFSELTLGPNEAFAQEAVNQVRSRLHFLASVGLGYLTLDRRSGTLSGGEAQRVHLASQVGNNLVGITYVLDEPSIGLHPVDNQRLIDSLQELRDRGNTVIVVEHDEQMIRSSDWILDFGPGAGAEGGTLLHQGTVQDLEAVSSPTANFLFGRTSIPSGRGRPQSDNVLSLHGITLRNLHDVRIDIPLGRFVAITGVSGSGKSTLLFDALLPALTEEGTQIYTSLKGQEHIDIVQCIDQSPIGRTPRSNPATYSGVFNEIRALYASLPESKARGWTVGRFSFNTAPGVCPTCSGAGQTPIDMDFLETAWVVCSTCQGRRYDRETLSVRYKGASILDVLLMSCKEAAEHFAAIPALKNRLDTLCRVGLGYVKLGQSATTLSGGEAQRLKIAKELGRRATSKTLYLLDEPTTGLHSQDVATLLNVLHELVDKGHTVCVIEHHMAVVKAADWIIDMGPGAGVNGGKIIATGSPDRMAKLDTPTGIALRAATNTPPPPRPPVPPTTSISVQGAQQHNLQRINLDLPTGRLIAIVGPSGSGKRSLAFHTLYAEGQRRYVESLSPYARQYIRQKERSSVDCIDGLPPTVAITQRKSAWNPRSTVGTMTAIYDYLRVVWARLGTPHCPKTKKEIRSMSAERAAQIVLSWQSVTPLSILAPLGGITAANVLSKIESLQRQGYSRARLNGTVIHLDEVPAITAGRRLRLEVVVDRLTPSTDEQARLISSIDEAARLGNNRLLVLTQDSEHPFHLAASVTETGESYPEITAQTFAFNTPYGGCPSCYGFGTISENVCPDCHGTRLNALARHVTIHDCSITDFCRMPMAQARHWLQKALPPNPEKPIQRLFDEIEARLSFIDKLGIGYLSLDRSAKSLSSGEAQRARLTSQIGSNLSRLLYVLDEPTTGLHPLDTENLVRVLKGLQQLGNTVITVDHDPQLLAHADHIVELGPDGGIGGGTLIFSGPRETFFSTPTMTSVAISDPLPLNRTPPLKKDPVIVRSASRHNLKDLSCTLPTQALVGIVGVSGAGKSTLLFDVIGEAMATHSKTVAGLENFTRASTIDQQPIGLTVRSDVLTFSDLSAPLRNFFSRLPQAQALGLQPSDFSPFTSRGMCRRCQGLGYRTVDMRFLPTARIICEACGGLRLNPTSLSVTYNGLTMGHMLGLSVAEVREMFEDHWKIVRILDTLIDVGGSYLRLGQEMASLSAGEVQRVKLARELASPRRGATLYLMDEPTAGLHPREVRTVLSHLKNLVQGGHTVIVVEHNLDMIASCDFLLELGPGAGEHGGRIVAQGTPWKVAHAADSPTGRYLKERC
jgi:excinuclease ABC subunit A